MSATENDQRAADWLQRKTFWSWSESDQAELDAWLDAADENRIAYWRQSAIWARTERLAALAPAPSGMRAPRAEQKSRWPGLLRIAAAFGVVAILGGVSAHYAMQPRYVSYSTTIGGGETITLADGTLIQLNTDTALRTRFDEKRREVILDKGEAFFQVTHDKARPFMVMAAGHRVVDLGTKFSVRNKVNAIEVALIEGMARIETANGENAQSAVLKPGDIAVATAENLKLTRKPKDVISRELGWRRGVLIFDNTTLADAAKEFNRYNHSRLVIADAATAAITIVGTFQANDVDAFADLAQFMLHLKVHKQGQKTIISR
ncbi:MAG TPA: FecR domain-containing protein [Rhizomicrobium sp.]|nr:FecR domain-containing protein [Rhizomicrobium sp.]